MFNRISAVSILCLTAVWLNHSGDWEAIIALITSVFIYIGFEISDNSERNKQHIRHEKQMTDFINRIELLESNERINKPIIDRLKKEYDVSSHDYNEKLKSASKFFNNDYKHNKSME
jgi:hypothetical protein